MAKFGRQIDFRLEIIDAPSVAKELGYGIFQIFLGAPQQAISKARRVSELKKMGEELERNKIEMVIHGSYTINLCHPRSSRMYKTSVRSLVQDLSASSIIGNRCIGVIVHMGKNILSNNISNDDALGNYVSGLKDALMVAPEDATIILETGASQGREVGSKIEDLAKIYWSLEKGEQRRIKICVDTCHIWATGYDISTASGVKNFFGRFDRLIGNDKIGIIHLNDSKTPLGSGVDRHADLGYGYINKTGLKKVVKFARKKNIPVIFETPLDAINPITNQEVTPDEELKLFVSWLRTK
ncbi:MAG: deoxyribonuclease IV [Nitrososphaerota archaeon]